VARNGLPAVVRQSHAGAWERLPGPGISSGGEAVSTKKQRRKQLARAKWERQRQRQALRARRARRRNIIIAVVLVVAIAAGGTALAALSGGDSSEPDTDAAGEPAPEPPEDPCEQPAPGEPTGGQWDSEPEMTVNEESTYVMQLDTTCGAIEI